ncbi:hypothetical protein T440DRAFT_470919 [Plenodomus tracheiphilus IPT5]|uniref:Borealin N-terminal domain-containing protein n=1 Tax=Plenodomus tracheiphilus IPT5 TaxID=1408161 RepID=A0A6A7AZN9_9PLEO|nr:hypothetical protein T440DRAFT_470919 [Plenodomus tracheiphilus IPT5]
MSNLQHKLTAEAKAAMIANLQLELDARKEKLRAQCEAQCASLQSRLERRINRIPPSRRQNTLSEILAGPEPSSSAPKHTVVAAKVTKNGGQKKTTAPKGRVANTTSTTTTKRSAATTTTRATRAAARTREVLSPKTDNAKPKAAAARSVKPR